MTIDLRSFTFPPSRTVDRVKNGIRPDFGHRSGRRVCVGGQFTRRPGSPTFAGLNRTASISHQSAPGPSTGSPACEAGGNLLLIDGDFKLGAFEVVDATQWRQDGRGGNFEQRSRSMRGASTAARTGDHQRAPRPTRLEKLKAASS